MYNGSSQARHPLLSSSSKKGKGKREDIYSGRSGRVDEVHQQQAGIKEQGEEDLEGERGACDKESRCVLER